MKKSETLADGSSIVMLPNRMLLNATGTAQN